MNGKSKMKRALVTGCNGLLGQKLIQYSPDGWQVFGLDLNDSGYSAAKDFYRKCDMQNKKELLGYIREVNPDWILNAAAFTNVDGAESQRDLCWKINVEAVENLVHAARKVKAKILHVSTDYIFAGNDGPYREDAIPDPTGFYGRSKLAGENVLKGSGTHFAIVRSMVLYGKAINIRPNFVTWLIDKLSKKEPVRIVTDQFGNVTLADELAVGIWRVVLKNLSGIFHIAGNEIVDRYTFAVKIAHIFNLDKRLIQPIKTSELSQAAPRPMRSGLVVDKAIKELGIKLSNVEEGLFKFKAQEAGRN